MQPVDILILSNGPGEITTWVRPVVKALRQELTEEYNSLVRISVILSPCPNASGKEAEIALSYPEVDRVQGADNFLSFLLLGKTQDNWNWRNQGVVIFLGGDQFFPVIIGKRLGYRTIVYAEWEARWHNLIDKFAVMKPEVIDNVAAKYHHKFTVVGDLMRIGELENSSQDNIDATEIIGLLPGSKAAKLTQGVPLTLAAAEYIYHKRPNTKFIIPVAPTLNLETLGSFANPKYNPYIDTFGGVSAELILPAQNLNSDSINIPRLHTKNGLVVELIQENPAYQRLSQCQICLTTVGANTAELASLGIPMIVLLPTQQIDAMRAWDGLPGLLANLPGVGTIFAKLINRLFLWILLQRKGLFAWPNIWAKSEVVPELLGALKPEDIGEMVLDYLNHPEKLAAMQEKLHSIRGEGGAAKKLARLVRDELFGENK
ncbi:hypothetical protein [Calothrix sp. 336/3]|uniref:hypothetical protein n=1 Tax=Calothrix sp. 336/3 TaxID=1337936 RepID=UPI0004E3E83F|nr:hypothetical protein [Calothrix sp. 336/3]AKG22374.1 lipid-A-disaccharide synthase [Calothrix sp. 336/3]